MPEPLDYWGSKTPGAPAAARRAQDVVPEGFDTPLFATRDRRMIGPIVRLLEREKIASHQSHDGAPIGRVVTFWIRAADYTRARPLVDALCKHRQFVAREWTSSGLPTLESNRVVW